MPFPAMTSPFFCQIAKAIHQKSLVVSQKNAKHIIQKTKFQQALNWNIQRHHTPLSYLTFNLHLPIHFFQSIILQ